MKLFIDKVNRTVEDFDNELEQFDLIPGIPYYAGPVKQLSNKRVAPLIKGSRNLDYLIKKFEETLI